MVQPHPAHMQPEKFSTPMSAPLGAVRPIVSRHSRERENALDLIGNPGRG